MNNTLMFLAFGLGALGAVMIVVAFIFTLTPKFRQAKWVKWVRWSGVIVMAASLAFMIVMTTTVIPAALKAS